MKFHPATPQPLEEMEAKVRASSLRPDQMEAALQIVRDEDRYFLEGRTLWFMSDEHTVIVDMEPDDVGHEFARLWHLSIRRNDREPMGDWREKQEIKNAVVGPEREAVELYPAESRLVDGANQYHLWVLAEEGLRWPFGWQHRLVTEGMGMGEKQRPLKQDRAARRRQGR